MSLEAEQACMGAVVTGGIAQDKVLESLLPEHFFDSYIREMFTIAMEIRKTGASVDAITVGSHAQAVNSVDDLMHLMEFCPSISAVDAYIDIVKTNWMRHKLAVVGAEIKQIAVNGESMDQMIDAAQSLITPLSAESSSVGFQHIGEASKKLILEIAQASRSGKSITGLATGFSLLDHMTGGLQNGDLVVVGGRPSMGKTATTMAIAHYVSQEHVVLVFSAEMQVKELVKRSVSMFSQIDFDRIKNAQVSKQDNEALQEAQRQHERRELYVDDRPGITISQLRSRAKAQARKTGCQLIVVDYLQLIKSANENRVQEVTAVSAGLKALAKEIDCPVIAIAQLSRSVEQRPDKRPINSDLRDSGTIEQDADLIAFCYMDEKYDEDSARKGIQEFIVRKQRQGPLGTVYLDFDGARQTITQHNGSVPSIEKKSGRKKLDDY